MPKRPTRRTIKITDTVRVAALKLPLTPAFIEDTEIRGFWLIVTTQRAFWAQFLQPRGRGPNGKRWTMVRHELGDAQVMFTGEARAAALGAKAAIRQGRETHTAKDWPPQPPLWPCDRSFRRPRSKPLRSTPRPSRRANACPTEQDVKNPATSLRRSG
jgi:hypothetical protein